MTGSRGIATKRLRISSSSHLKTNTDMKQNTTRPGMGDLHGISIADQRVTPLPDHAPPAPDLFYFMGGAPRDSHQKKYIVIKKKPERQNK